MPKISFPIIIMAHNWLRPVFRSKYSMTGSMHTQRIPYSHQPGNVRAWASYWVQPYRPPFCRSLWWHLHDHNSLRHSTRLWSLDKVLVGNWRDIDWIFAAALKRVDVVSYRSSKNQFVIEYWQFNRHSMKSEIPARTACRSHVSDWNLFSEIYASSTESDFQNVNRAQRLHRSALWRRLYQNLEDAAILTRMCNLMHVFAIKTVLYSCEATSKPSHSSLDYVL